MKDITKILLIVCSLSCIVGCDFSNKEKSNGDSTEQYERTDDLSNLNADSLLHVWIESNGEEDFNENIRIEIDFTNETICGGKAIEFRDDDDTFPEVKTLTQEQCKELKEYIVEYSGIVQEKKKDYWPHTDEYPEMEILFKYKVWFGDKEHWEEYKETGALCYPDGWDEFITNLLASCEQGKVGTEESVKERIFMQEMDTGAFNKGSVYYNGYKISIECPEVGHPSGDSLWSTYYKDENSNTDISVDIYGKEGSCEDRIEELTGDGQEVYEGILWGNSCSYYIDDITIALIPLGEERYLQIEIATGYDSMRVPSSFALTIEEKE